MQMSPEIFIEAMRLAKPLVRQAIKDQGQKVCWYSSDDIRRATHRLIEIEPSIIQRAWDICKMRYEARQDSEQQFVNQRREAWNR